MYLSHLQHMYIEEIGLGGFIDVLFGESTIYHGIGPDVIRQH